MESRHRLLIIWTMILVVLASLAIATTITEGGYFGNYVLNKFSTGSSTELLQFDGSNSQKVFLELPKYSQVSYVNINGIPTNTLKALNYTLDNSTFFFWNEGTSSNDSTQFDLFDMFNTTTTGYNSALFDPLNNGADLDNTLSYEGGNSTRIDQVGADNGIKTKTTLFNDDQAMTHEFFVRAGTSDNRNPVVRIVADATTKCIIGDSAGHFGAGSWKKVTYEIFDNTSVKVYIDDSFIEACALTGSWDTADYIEIINNDGGFTSNVDYYRVWNGSRQDIPTIGGDLSSENNLTGFQETINSYLSTCTADSNGLCAVPLTFNTSSVGNLSLDISQTLNYSIQYNVTYDSSTIEKDNDNFLLTFYQPNANGTLWYENNPQTTTSTTGSGQTNFSSTFRVDWVDNSSSILNETKQMFWNITFNGTNDLTNNHSQTVHKMFINDSTSCGYPVTLNISTFNASTSNPYNANVDIAFDIWHESQTYSRSYALAFSGSDNYEVCIYPEFVNYTTNAQAEYTAAGFSTKLYYLAQATLSNISQAINLILTEDTTQVQFTVTDYSDDPVSGVNIKILEYDVGSDTSEVVEIIQTDDNGDAYGQIVLNTQFYKFILEKGGEILLETNPTKITSTTNKFRVSLEADYLENYETAQGVAGSVTFSNSTGDNIFEFVFSDPSNTITQACLSVDRMAGSGSARISEECLSSSAGTISYNITEATGMNTYIGQGYVKFSDGSQFPIDGATVSFNNLSDTFGASGLFMAFFLVITLIIAGLGTGHPVGGVMLAAVGVGVMGVFGLLNLSWPYLVVYWIIAVITLYKLK